MCGIWGYFGIDHDVRELFDSFTNIQNRGPTRSEFMEVNSEYPIFFGFHRLPIVENTAKGDQPFTYEENQRRVYVGCNGEIYNYQKLIEEYNLPVKTGSDCEVILWLYIQLGIDRTLELLNGEFAFYIFDFDLKTNIFKVHLTRDQCGIRPLFYAVNDESIAFSSEAKGLTSSLGKQPRQIISGVLPFPPRTRFEATVKIIDDQSGDVGQNGKQNGDSISVVKANYTMVENVSQQAKTHNKHKKLQITNFMKEYTSFRNIQIKIEDDEKAKALIRDCLDVCIEERLHSYAEIGALLSGGLDSSLICAIAAKHLKKLGKQLKTFSVGMPGSTDKEFAEKVALHIGSEHRHIEFQEDDFLNALDEVILLTETFDITTIRATTGQFLISRWIAQNTNIKVLLIGDGSDELCAGYMYFHKAPDALASHNENIRLLENIHLYDCLRADRAIARNGMEARVPFLDKKFIELYLSIKYELRIPRPHKFTQGAKMEKYLLRESFAGTGLLPDEVLFRKKEAFSDGVSSVSKSWYVIIQEWASNSISDEDLEKAKKEYVHLPPTSKESLYYRRKFEHFYGKGDICKVTPGYWLPLWCGNITDPSARVLTVYNNTDN